MARPTTHEDLLDTYNTRTGELGCGFLLAGELDEAAHVLVNEEPALGQDMFRLRCPSVPWGYIELGRWSCELPRFGCCVTYYSTGMLLDRPAIEGAFIELLDGAVPAS